MKKKKTRKFVVSTKNNEKKDDLLKFEPPAPVLNTSTSKDSISNFSVKSKTISISTISKERNKEELAQKEKNIRKNKFSKEDLILAWQELVSKVKIIGKSNLAILLSTFPPELKNDFIIVVKLINSSQLEILNEQEYLVLEFLRENLQNDCIQIKKTIINVPKKDIIYTNTDKFNKMLEQNEQLNNLREELGLDPDY